MNIKFIIFIIESFWKEQLSLFTIALVTCIPIKRQHILRFNEIRVQSISTYGSGIRTSKCSNFFFVHFTLIIIEALNIARVCLSGDISKILELPVCPRRESRFH